MLDADPRGLKLQELIDTLNMQVCNHPCRLAKHDAWTYEHTLHGRHYIDLILASHHWTVIDGKAAIEIEFRSDQRALRTSMHLRT